MQLVFPLQKKTMWSPPIEYKDLSDAKEIAIDLETRKDIVLSIPLDILVVVT